MSFEFKCVSCGEMHRGMPSFGTAAPLSYYAVPEKERAARCSLGTDECVIDKELYFIHGCLDIPVEGEDEPFSWGVWVSLSESSFKKWLACFDTEKRSQIGPFFGWLNTRLKPYPETVNLKTMAHLRDGGIRPYIELEPTDHPLAIEQRTGISVSRVAELYIQMVHDAST
jgi:hypothetical protein